MNQKINTDQGVIGVEELLNAMASFCTFLFSGNRFRFADSKVFRTFGGDCYVVLQSEELQIRVVRDSWEIFLDFWTIGQASGDDWFAIELVRQMITGETEYHSHLDADNARFLCENLDVIEQSFTKESLATTTSKLEDLQNIRAEQIGKTSAAGGSAAAMSIFDRILNLGTGFTRGFRQLAGKERQAVYVSKEIPGLKELLIGIASFCTFLLFANRFRFVDSEVFDAFGGDCYVTLESKLTQIRLVRERTRKILIYIRPVAWAGKKRWFSIDIARRILTGAEECNSELDADNADFLSENLDPIERLFEEESLEATVAEAKRLERNGAKKPFG